MVPFSRLFASMAIVEVSLQQPKDRDIVGSVMRYVDQNYAAPISLSDVDKAHGRPRFSDKTTATS